VKDFVPTFPRTRKSVKKIKILTDQAYGNKSLNRTQLYKIFNEVIEGKYTSNQRHFNPLISKRTEDTVADVIAAFEEERCLTA
jgi:hypothetical protein